MRQMGAEKGRNPFGHFGFRIWKSQFFFSFFFFFLFLVAGKMYECMYVLAGLVGRHAL